MTDLTAQVIRAHGGLDRFQQYETATVDFRSGGGLWPLKGQAGIFDRATVRVDLHRQHASHYPFTAPGLRTSFTAERVAVENDRGEVQSERLAPRDAFKGHTVETPWDDLHVAYFAGYAMWTYLTSPFTFVSPGFRTEELSPVTEAGETWSRLKVTFPEEIATHCREQVFYFGEDGLLRRHDYTAEVINGGPAAHYTYDHAEFGGIMVPTRRRVHPLGEDGAVVRDIELVTIDIENVDFA
ncbi:hypothetical protein ADL00_43305 [Streptomyces sp. AS58]|uniref:Uncharacterized protein n=1 Tax=Streptomyces cadmiisoli TaxID=2184053 RepID=A0A2Z4IT13_9ACTN|nr:MULTISPECIES: hypothetical protein [Streptomyces]AWW35985.1 hypothetical protein DN051_04420 [Streptomyces cadmiisoli]KOV50640.1 hypothetical protein ADL00_43305 [Streptomyces sp. AS58]